MKQEITVGQLVTGNLRINTKSEQKYLEYEGVVCGKGNHRKTDLLIKVQGIVKPFWVMGGSVKLK